MKIQDLIFLVILFILIYKKRADLFAFAALFSLLLSIPFYYLWIFFTAQRLVEYAFVLLIFSLLLFAVKKRYHK